jgi:ribosomal protein S18 acetylase RimI-like enzyme
MLALIGGVPDRIVLRCRSSLQTAADDRENAQQSFTAQRSLGSTGSAMREAGDDFSQSCEHIHGPEGSSSESQDGSDWLPEELRHVGPVECDDVASFIWWSQVKRRYSRVHLATFQDSKAAAPLSHQLLSDMAVHGPQGLLGVRRWPCEVPGAEPVQLHIECAAAGTRNGCAAANRMRVQLMRLLTKDFSRKYISGPVLGGRNLRDRVHATIPHNLDNRAALQIAFLDESSQQVVGAAIMYIHGPAFGYLPFFAVSPEQRGSGLGSRFAGALCSVLRFLRVQALVVEACVDPATRDDRVVRFWQRAGLEKCTDEYFDNYEPHTNTQRSQRVSGCAIRGMSGVFAFPDSCIMFRGTAEGWSLGAEEPVMLPAGFQQCSASAPAQLAAELACESESSGGMDSPGGGEEFAGDNDSGDLAAAAAPRCLDTVRSFTACVCVPLRACPLLWRVRPSTCADVLQATPKDGEGNTVTDGATVQITSQRSPSPLCPPEKELKEDCAPGKASLMSRACTALLRVLTCGCIGRASVVE